jgi:hypothetical protein
LTHDLLKNICTILGAKISHIVITDLHENTFYAEIHICASGKEMVIDARPSDAIALALRTSAPVFVLQKLSEHMLQIKDILEEEMEEFRTGRTMRLTKRVTNEQARNFFLSNHRKLSSATDGRERVDPYWIAIDKNVYLAFSKQSHSQRVFTWLNTMSSKNRPKIKAPKNVPEMHINIFSTLSEAVTDLRALGQAFDIPESTIRQELRELKDDVTTMRGVRVKPIRSTR